MDTGQNTKTFCRLRNLELVVTTNHFYQHHLCRDKRNQSKPLKLCLVYVIKPLISYGNNSRLIHQSTNVSQFYELLPGYRQLSLLIYSDSALTLCPLLCLCSPLTSQP